jgi:hypothetical protein
LEERWSIDLPPIVPQLSLHRLIGKQCCWGCKSKGEFPGQVKGYVSYGPNMRAMTGYLNTEQHIPYKRLSELMKDLFHLPISQGTVYNILKEIQHKGQGLYRQIRHRISSSSVVGADETGVHINGGLNWFWVFQRDLLTYVFPDKSRGGPAIPDFDNASP